MRPIPTLILLLSLALPAAAQEVAAMPDDDPVVDERVGQTVGSDEIPAPTLAAVVGPIPVEDRRLEDFLWTSRLVVVFADTPRDPAFIRQLELLTSRLDALATRDVVVLVDTDPAARSAIRTSLRPRGFATVIVDKDGSVLQRKPTPWDVREISRTIDKTPLRQQELREMRDAEAARRGGR